MRYLTTLGLALALAGDVAAQSFARMMYSTGSPFGEMKDYISEASWLGFQFESGRFTRENLSFGVSLGWQVFHEKTDEPVQIADAAAAQGTQMRYINAFPLMAQIQLHRANPRGGDLYIGINGGTYYIEKRTDVSVLSLIDDNWHLGFAPQAGIIFPLGYGRGYGIIDARYNYALEADGAAYNWWTFSIGVAYGPRY